MVLELVDGRPDREQLLLNQVDFLVGKQQEVDDEGGERLLEVGLRVKLDQLFHAGAQLVELKNHGSTNQLLCLHLVEETALLDRLQEEVLFLLRLDFGLLRN